MSYREAYKGYLENLAATTPPAPSSPRFADLGKPRHLQRKADIPDALRLTPVSPAMKEAANRARNGTASADDLAALAAAGLEVMGAPAAQASAAHLAKPSTSAIASAAPKPVPTASAPVELTAAEEKIVADAIVRVAAKQAKAAADLKMSKAVAVWDRARASNEALLSGAAGVIGNRQSKTAKAARAASMWAKAREANSVTAIRPIASQPAAAASASKRANAASTWDRARAANAGGGHVA